MKRYLTIARLAVLATGFLLSLASCESLDEQPEINKGYKSNVRIPDGEPLTDEDRDYIEEQEIEYEDNVG